MSAGCEYYERFIFMLPDGLTDQEADELREHLRTCPRCRRLFNAFADATETLQNEQAEPPAALAEVVLTRVFALEKVRADLAAEQREAMRKQALESEFLFDDEPAPDEKAVPETEIEMDTDMGPEPAGAPAGEEPAEPVPAYIPREPDARRRRRRAGRWLPVAAAACLVVVVGSAVGLTVLLRGGSAAPSEARVQESILLEAPSAPFPLPEEAPAMDGAALSAEAPVTEEDALDEAPAEQELLLADSAAEEPAETETAAAAAAEAAREAPAAVPEGREDAFEALLSSAGQDAGSAGEDLRVIAAVEYRGVIYEFLTDASESALFWRDAAESAYPMLSPADVGALWDVLG